MLHLTVETATPGDHLPDRLRDALMTIEHVRHNVERRGHVVFGALAAVAPGTLSKGRRKTVRIVDKRG